MGTIERVNDYCVLNELCWKVCMERSSSEPFFFYFFGKMWYMLDHVMVLCGSALVLWNTASQLLRVSHRLKLFDSCFQSQGDRKLVPRYQYWVKHLIDCSICSSKLLRVKSALTYILILMIEKESRIWIKEEHTLHLARTYSKK